MLQKVENSENIKYSQSMNTDVEEIKKRDFDKFIGAVVKQLDKTCNLQIVNNDSKIIWDNIKSISELQKITYLDLSRKDITFLPPEIGYLKNLKKIELSHNKLNSLPIEINELVSLKRLILNFNQFTTFPKDICLPNLDHLEIQDNQLNEFPYLTNTEKVTDIYLHFNNITQIPSNEQLQSFYPNLNVVYLKYNPLIINQDDVIPPCVIYKEVIIDKSIVSANYRYEGQ